MGGGLSSLSCDASMVINPVNEKVLELFPKFHCYTTDAVTAHDYKRAISLCSSIIDINKNGRMMDRTQFLDYFSSLILFYDKFFIVLASTKPSSVLVFQSMLFRLTFLSDLVTTLLLARNTVDGNPCTLEKVQKEEELQLVVDFARRYQLKGVRIQEYGGIGEALITCMSGGPEEGVVWWKYYMWLRIYSHFLRLLQEYTATPDYYDACIDRTDATADSSKSLEIRL